MRSSSLNALVNALDRLQVVREAGALPGLDLFAHGLDVSLHAVHSDREDVHEAQVLGVLGEHGREHA